MSAAPWRDGATEDDRWNGYLANPDAWPGDPDYGLLANKVGASTFAELRWKEGALSEARNLQLR